MNIKLISIDEIGLSNRAGNSLHKNKIHTVGEMLLLQEENISSWKNVGPKTVNEILSKIEEYKNYEKAGGTIPTADYIDLKENYQDWLALDTTKAFIKNHLRNTKTGTLELLSAKAYNILNMNDVATLDQIIFCTPEELMPFFMMDSTTAEEIVRNCRMYLKQHKDEILAAFSEMVAIKKEQEDTDVLTISKAMANPSNRKMILDYVRENDIQLHNLGLSVRAFNRLSEKGFQKLSDFIFVTAEELVKIPHMGAASVKNILQKIDEYLASNGDRILKYMSGDASVLYDDTAIKTKILSLYEDGKFNGLSLNDITSSLALPEFVTIDRIKKNIGELIASGKLEYLDYRCYLVYRKFEECLAECPDLNEREYSFIQLKLDGKTLEEIGKMNDITREWVRQLINKGIKKVKSWYLKETGLETFDEEYYRYLYENYQLNKNELGEWLDIPASTWRYLALNDAKNGENKLSKAHEDRKLDAGIRQRIRNYLNKDKIYVDGLWLEKKRTILENFILQKYCTEELTFKEFTELYNRFLKDNGISDDDDLYYSDPTFHSRQNVIKNSRKVLWKVGFRLRYYDIDSQDYTELLDILNLDIYENIEFSTEKFMMDYPEIMEKYDIRDHYELHNLLKKILKNGSYHDLNIGTMPHLQFGTFDRIEATEQLLMENSPIRANDLAELVHMEYGFDTSFVLATFLSKLSQYNHNGLFSVDQKIMSSEHKLQLKAVLTEDFYYFNEVRAIYTSLFPDGDPDVVNAFNLKGMGYVVGNKYILVHHHTLEAFMEDLLTKDDILDLTGFRKRFGYKQAFYKKLFELTKSRTILEYEPNKFINIRRLESIGITDSILQDYCDTVDDFVEDNTYFSIQSLRQAGFHSELDDSGLKDRSLANVLYSDDRFSWGNMYGNVILYKGEERIEIKTFLLSIIKRERVIDILDLMKELKETYGCTVADKWDILKKLEGTTVYYDRYLERLYITEDEFYRDLD